MDLEEFKKKNKPKKSSSLDEYREDILNLGKARYSHEKIAEYIRSEGVSTTRQNVTRWIKKNKSSEEKINSNKNEIKEANQNKQPSGNEKVNRLESFFSKKN